MSECCSAFECAADQQFNEKKATEELHRYRTKGPGPTTRLIQEAPSWSYRSSRPSSAGRHRRGLEAAQRARCATITQQTGRVRPDRFGLGEEESYLRGASASD
jgi:hypothetical protein